MNRTKGEIIGKNFIFILIQVKNLHKDIFEIKRFILFSSKLPCRHFGNSPDFGIEVKFTFRHFGLPRTKLTL